jgi:exonuclease III
MASINKPQQMRKIYGILKLRTDFIFLSDVRISSRNLVSSYNDVVSIFRNNQYGSYSTHFNSTKNKRGVGILINNSLSFAELARREDTDENYLLLRIRIRGSIVIIGAIYGPNTVDNDFFERLQNDIRSLGNYPVILAGDWNATYSCLPVEANPDCLNMANLPNVRHSILINNLCDNLNLLDPYRSLEPHGRTFTYCPRAAGATNRSRIDFFLISDTLLDTVAECTALESLQSSMFDHKAILLKFSGRQQAGVTNNIKYRTISDPDTDILIQISITECFIIYQDRPRNERNNLMSLIGRCMQLLRDAGPDLRHYNLSFNTVEEYENRNTCLAEINLIFESQEWRDIKNYNINIEEDLFFEMILNNVRNDLISYQIFLNRTMFRQKKVLRDRIKTLSINFQVNYQDIAAAEKLLQRISEDEIEAALYNHPVFEHINGEKMSPRFLRLAKGRERTDSLFNIVDDHGELYRTNALCKEAVTKYFQDIYTVPVTAPDDYAGLIEGFLGPDICNNEIVLGCKLTEGEADNLDLDLSIAELDAAAGTGKVRSAPGIDGFNNFFYKKVLETFQGASA